MRQRRTRLALKLAGALGLCGCAGTAPSAEAPQEPATKPAAPPPATSTAAPAPRDEKPRESLNDEAASKPDMPPAGAPLDRIMRAHFKDALLIRKAIISGKSEDAANPATVLALIETLDDLPPGWRPFVERMQADARHIRDSTSAAQAAAATADLGVACGLCHQKLGGPKVSSEPAPAPGTSVDARMQVHAWASERLWEGLTVPSGEAWAKGAKALSASPFPEEVLTHGGVHARSAASEFAKIVVRAPSKKTTEERAALYAELLVTCGGCHRATSEGGAKLPP